MIFSKHIFFFTFVFLLWSCSQPYTDYEIDPDLDKLTTYDSGKIADIVQFSSLELGYIDSQKDIKLFNTQESTILEPFLNNSDMDLNEIVLATRSDGVQALFTIDRYNNIWARRYDDALADGWMGDPINCSNSEMVHGDSKYPVRFTINDELTDIFILFDHPESSSTSLYDDSYILGKRTLYRGSLLFDEDDGIFENQGCTLLSETSYIVGGDTTFLSFSKDASNIYYSNNQLYVINPTNDQVVTIDSPSENPSLGASISVEKPEQMVFNNNKIYIARDGYGGVEVVSNTGISIDSFAAGFTVNDIFIDEASNYIALSCGYHGVLIYSIDSENKYNEKLAIATSFAYSSVLTDDILYVATKNGIEKIDLTEELK